ncbi:MAG TPA: urea ABC transporter permease subunit UrtC [Tepidisphaeraceae bacterium]|jgi:urea transport system permease protein
MSVLKWWRRSGAFAFLAIILVMAGRATAQGTTQPNDVERVIRTTLPLLKDRSTAPAALNTLQALRDERVLHLFEHLRDNTLYESGSDVVFVPGFRDAPGGGKVGDVYDLFVPLDAGGLPAAPPLRAMPVEELKGREFTTPRPVRVAVLNALRVLGLKMDDPGLRRTAARDLGGRRQADAVPDLRAIAESDPVPAVRLAARESIDLILATSTDSSVTPEQRVAAVKSLGELKSLRALDALKEAAAKPGLPPDTAAAYATSIGQIQRHLSVTNWIKNVFFGLSAGSILVLLALGLAITFGLMGVINMAHGEMMMIGAVTTWACCEFIGPKLPAAYFDYYYVIAFPASFLVAAAFGLLIEVSIVRWLYKRPLDSLLATIGVSYILIQLVRNWKGDNLGMRTPAWAGRNWEVIQDVLLPYNRLFLIALTIFCLLSVVALFRYTKLGLMIRATVQNREMAQALGVNTRLVDMTTFAFGAGLAGLAGYGIVLTSNPSPEIGQTFIVKSFLTVVVGGVGKVAGVIFSGLGLGFIEKLLEPIQIIQTPIRLFDATWAQVAALVAVILFMQRRPAGLFPDKGRAADQADRISAPPVPKITTRGDLILGSAMLVFGLLLVPLLYGTGLMSLEYVNKLGYIFSFAICAIGLDLVWGYIGVLSLMQFLFFSIGGYCMGLYLICHGPMDGPNKDIPRALYVVMSAVSGGTPPWFLSMFKSFPVALLLGMLLPGLLALLIGLGTFRSRVKGVYFSILTQAITVAFWLVFQKNEMSLGGTNGLTNYVSILGYPIQASADAGKFGQTRFWLYVASFVAMALAIVVAKLLVNSGFGRVLVAVRDDETRLRFVGYQTWAYKAAAFTLAAAFAGLGGMLYVPQKGIITPQQIDPKASILVVAWVAVGGRGTVWGAALGAILIGLLYDKMTSEFSEYWYFVLGSLFILVPLLLPGGVISLPMVIRNLAAKRKTGAPLLDTTAVPLAEAR